MEAHYAKNWLLIQDMRLWNETWCWTYFKDCSKGWEASSRKINWGYYGTVRIIRFRLLWSVWYWETLSGEKGGNLPKISLGISLLIGAEICYWIWNKNWNVSSRSTVQHIAKEDLQDPKLKEMLASIDNKNQREILR